LKCFYSSEKYNAKLSAENEDQGGILVVEEEKL
jgi:hypothetical protein